MIIIQSKEKQLTRRQTARDASRRIAKRKLREFRVARAAVAASPNDWFLGEPLDPWLGWDHDDEGGDPAGSFQGMKVVVAIEEMLSETNWIRHRVRGSEAMLAGPSAQWSPSADYSGSPAQAIADEGVVDWMHAVAADPLSLAAMIRDDPVQLDGLRSLWVRTIGPLAGSSANDARREREQVRWLNCIELAVLSHPLWVRPLSTWTGDSPRSLLEHLLVLYPVPEVLYGWMLDGLTDYWALAQRYYVEPARASRAWPWFVARAQGGSPRRVLQSLGVDLTDSFIAAFEQAVAWPRGVSFGTSEEVLTYGEVVRLGGSIVDFHRLRRVDQFKAHPAFNRWGSPPSGEDQVVPQELYVDTARWIISQRDRMTDEQAVAVLHWAFHKAHEAFSARRRGNAATRFSWKGRTAHSAIAAAQRHFDRIHRAKPVQALSWASHGWDWEWMDDSTPVQSWKVVELLNSEQLANEGAAQSHCVGFYANDCAAGRTAIFQLLRDGRRQLTIEVAVTTRNVVQVRGRLSSPALPDDRQVVMRWVSAKGLHVSKVAW